MINTTKNVIHIKDYIILLLIECDLCNKENCKDCVSFNFIETDIRCTCSQFG